MPREILVVTDLTPEQQARYNAEQKRKTERAKDPATLSLPDRVTRIERIFGLE